MNKKIIVAIDGYSSCGKSTIAKELANYAGYTYVDTGAMYRAIALFSVNKGWITESDINEAELKAHIQEIQIEFRRQADGHQELYLNGKNEEKNIRTLQIANAASRVSAIGFVRQHLVHLQQMMGLQKGIVMDGRDIGTVVFPKAELKLFLTASPEIRAERRYKELEEKGEKVCYEDVLANVKERDYRDTHRTESPLKQADDAILFDNSTLSRAEQTSKIQQIFDHCLTTL